MAILLISSDKLNKLFQQHLQILHHAKFPDVSIREVVIFVLKVHPPRLKLSKNVCGFLINKRKTRNWNLILEFRISTNADVSKKCICQISSWSRAQLLKVKFQEKKYLHDTKRRHARNVNVAKKKWNERSIYLLARGSKKKDRQEKLVHTNHPFLYCHRIAECSVQ